MAKVHPRNRTEPRRAKGSGMRYCADNGGNLWAVRVRVFGGSLVPTGVLVCGLVGCGAGVSRPTARVIADATTGADTAHFDTVIVEAFAKPESSFLTRCWARSISRTVRL